jgi:deazaflavin-dependent oxidoreductase (nitroreductase family)
LESPVGRAVQKMAGSKAFMRVGPKIVPHMDRLIHKVSGGKFISSGGLLPSLVLTVRGAKTGQPRTTPLATMPDGESWYVVGSNFGKDSHPVWTVNLMANPDAEISYRGRKVPVHATLLSAEEKQAIWSKLTTFWPNYDVYTERSGRDLRVFRLDPR